MKYIYEKFLIKINWYCIGAILFDVLFWIIILYVLLK